MDLLMQVHWRDIWKHAVEKSKINATNVNMPFLRYIIWGDVWNIWGKPFEDSFENTQRRKVKTNAANATMHSLGQAIWGHIGKRTMEKSQKNITSVTLHPLQQVVGGLFENTPWRKSKQMQPMWLCIFSEIRNQQLYGRVGAMPQIGNQCEEILVFDLFPIFSEYTRDYFG